MQFLTGCAIVYPFHLTVRIGGAMRKEKKNHLDEEAVLLLNLSLIHI